MRRLHGACLIVSLSAAVTSCEPRPCRDAPETGDPVDGAPRLLAVVPADRTGEVPLLSDVLLEFDRPMDTSAGTVTLEGHQSGLRTSWNDEGDVLVITPLAPFRPFSTVTVELGDDFRDAAGNPLGSVAKSTFVTAVTALSLLRPPSGDPTAGWHFEEVALAAGVDHVHDYRDEDLDVRRMTAGLAAGDYDGDGFVDLYFGQGGIGRTRLYHNEGDGSFVERTLAAGVLRFEEPSNAPMFADWTGDGWLDLLVPGLWTFPTRAFVNNGDATFTEVTDTLGIITHGEDWWLENLAASFGDPDKDGDLDLFLGHYLLHEDHDAADPRYLWQNEGDGTFTDITTEAGLFYVEVRETFTPSFADIDDDGWADLLITGDHGWSVLMKNRGDGTFVKDTEIVLDDENGMGADIADYDNDGDLDWFVTSIWDPNGISEYLWGTTGSRLYQNQGDGTFIDVSESAGVRQGYWGWAACFADLDNDGHLDIFHVNGWVTDRPVAIDEYGADPSRLFHANGDGTFTERSAELDLIDTLQGRGVSCFDYDRDGDIDLVVSNYEGRAEIFRNDLGSDNHFLSVKLRGGGLNSEAIGARIYVTTGQSTQMRELDASSNFTSQSPVEAHFGLGEHEVVDTLRIVWPDGTVSETWDVKGDRHLWVEHPLR